MADLNKKLEDALAEVKRINAEISKNASQKLKDAINSANTEAETLVDNGTEIHEDVATAIKKLVKTVFGTKYGVRPAPPRKFDWDKFTKELKQKKITTKAQKKTKSEIADLVEKMPSSSQWNKDKNEYLNSDGEGKNKKYWTK